MLRRLFAQKLTRDSFIYMGVNGICALFPLLLIPVFTRLLSPADYGMYGNFIAAVGIVSVLLSLNVEQAIRRQYVTFSKKELAQSISSLLRVPFLLTFLSCSVVYFSSTATELMQIWISLPRNYMIIALLTGCAIVIFNLGSYLATMQLKPLLYASWRIGQVILFSGLSLLFIIYWRQSAEDIILGRALSLALIALSILLWCYRQGYLTLTWESTTLKKGLLFGIPLIPAMFFDPAITFIDRVFITQNMGLANTGIYTFAYQLSQPIHLFTSTLGLPLYPYIMQRLEENTATAHAQAQRIVLVGIAILLTVSTLYCLIIPIALPLLGGQDYQQAAPLVPWLVAAFTIGGISTLVANKHLHAHRTWLVSLATIAGLITNIIGNFLFTSPTGVAQATLLGYGLTLLILWSARSKP